MPGAQEGDHVDTGARESSCVPAGGSHDEESWNDLGSVLKVELKT